MPIYIEFANLIVSRDIISKKYIGGEEAFLRDFFSDGKMNTEDSFLYSISRMNPEEFDLDLLKKRGLDWGENSKSSKDFNIITRYGGFSWESNWLEGNNIFVYHKLESNRNKERANYISNEITMDKIKEFTEKGEVLLKTF